MYKVLGKASGGGKAGGAENGGVAQGMLVSGAGRSSCYLLATYRREFVARRP